MALYHKTNAYGKDRGLQYAVTTLYDIKLGIFRPKIKLVFLLCLRLFSFEAQAVYCYQRVIVTYIVHPVSDK